MQNIEPFAIRLTHGMDLKRSIQAFVTTEKIQAGAIVSCVGSLRTLNLRLAGAQSQRIWTEPLEIVSVMGTLTPHHQHIHISAANRNGDVIGGHLLEGSIIDTTAELILNNYRNFKFSREFDIQTGYTELSIQSE